MSEPLKEEFVSIGAVLISDEGPSFGTPIFVNSERTLHFVQSSSNGALIDEFIALPFRVTGRKNFVELRSNHTTAAGSAFLFGFRDKEGKLTISEKSTLQLRLRMEIDEYARWPFLSFAIARFLEHHGIVNRIIKTKEIASAIAAGELDRPTFTIPVPGYMEEEEIESAIADGGLDEQMSEIEKDLRRSIKEKDIVSATPEGELGRPKFNNEGAGRRNIKAKEVVSEIEGELDRPDFTKPLSPLSFDNWPDIRVRQLTKMWNEGLSVGQIAAELGNIPRTAVIEKINKLRLPDRPRSKEPG